MIKNNYLMKQGQGQESNMNSINSKRDMTKFMNNNKPYPIIEQNTYLSQQLKKHKMRWNFLKMKTTIQ